MRRALHFVYEELAHICGVLLALLAAVVGASDAEMPGALAGFAVGLFFGEVLGWIGVSLLVLLSGSRVTSDPASDEPATLTAESRGRRVIGRILRALLITGLIVFLHECYCLANLGALAINHNTGVFLTQGTSRGDSREFLKDGLRERRWKHDIIDARPIRWLLTEDVSALNHTNVEFIDLVNGKGWDKPGNVVEEKAEARLLAELWRSTHWGAQTIADITFNLYGNALCARTQEETLKYRAKGWVLRFLPERWFLH